MKKISLILSFVIACASLAVAQSDLTTTYAPPYVKAYQSESAWVGEKGRVRWDIVTYSVERFGGSGNAAGLIDLGLVIPDNAIVIDGVIDVIDATLPITAEFSIQVESAEDMLATTSNLTAGVSALIVDGAAANAVKTTAARNVYLKVDSGTLTDGVIKIWLKSLLSQ